MEFDNNRPIYLQIIDVLKQRLIMGELKPGDKMPSVREFSKDLKVNPTTIQRVYRELEHEELTFTKRGMGSFVTEDTKRVTVLKGQMAEVLTSDYIHKMSLIGMDEASIIQKIHTVLQEENKK